MSSVTPKLLGMSPNREHMVEALSEMRSIITGFETMLAVSPRKKVDGETVLVITPTEILRVLDLLRRNWGVFERMMLEAEAVSTLGPQQVDFEHPTENADSLAWTANLKASDGGYVFTENQEDLRQYARAIFEVLKEKNVL